MEALSTKLDVFASDGAVGSSTGSTVPGLIRSCGGTGGDEPTEAPKHDFTCTDASELIHFTPAFGSATPAGPGVEVVLDADSRVLELRSVRGGPIPAGGGITAAAEGFHWPEDPGFYHRFGIRRNPRTLAGMHRDGRLLLITIEGRRPGYSAGARFDESARVMAALGAVDAVNLDGGGSTGLTLGAGLITWPSDATGERPIGDALLVGGRHF